MFEELFKKIKARFLDRLADASMSSCIMHSVCNLGISRSVLRYQRLMNA